MRKEAKPKPSDSEWILVVPESTPSQADSFGLASFLARRPTTLNTAGAGGMEGVQGGADAGGEGGGWPGGGCGENRM